MRKCLLILMAVLLLLSGCSGTQGQADPMPSEPETTGLYDPNHPIERKTMGAVRAYPLEDTGYWNLLCMGNKLLLLKEKGEATVLQGEDCGILIRGKSLITDDKTVYDINAQGFAVYDPENNEVVRMNPQLQQVESFGLPEDIQGVPAISLAANTIFYCQTGQIRAMDMDTGIARLIKSHIVEDQTLIGSFFDGTVVACRETDAEGRETVIYISTADGTTVYEGDDIQSLVTFGETYIAQRNDNTVIQTVVGNRVDESMELTIPEEGSTLYQALQLGGMVSCAKTETGTELSFHDLNRKGTTAKLLLEGSNMPLAVTADEHFVWLLMQERDAQAVYRWDVQASALTEAVPTIAPLHTVQNPDTEGIKAVEKAAKELGKTYGVDIRIWEEAAKTTGDYAVSVEYQPAVFTAMLDRLEAALRLFPEGFLDETICSGNIRLCLVRSIAGDLPWVQVWAESDCIILLSSQADVKESFLAAVGNGIDSHVLGNSRDYDTWNDLNPSGFKYGVGVQYPKLLEGDTRAFVEAASMNSLAEDRRTLFQAAMADDNEETFAAQTMQKKLRRMCEGIREAYGLEKEKVVYPWELYLKEPIMKVEYNG